MNLSNAKVQRTDWIGHSSALRKLTKDEIGDDTGWLYKDDDVQSFAGLALFHGVNLADIDGFIEGLEAQGAGAGAELRERRTKAFEGRKDKEVFLRNLEWITSRRREIQRESAFRGEIKRLKREAAKPTQTAPAPSPATLAPKPASDGPAKRSNRKPSWAIVTMPYMKSLFTASHYKSAAVFYKALMHRAGESDSPFKLVNRELYCTEAGTTVSDGALGNVWAEIRAH